MKKPFFSIIIPTYNRKDFLKIAIESVFAQTFSDFELIISDDGSTDNTKEFIEKINNPKINYLWQNHQGVSAARNNAIRKAGGNFICFLDSDDRFRPDKLMTTHDYIKKYPDYKIFHTEEIWYRNGELLPQKIYHQKPSGLIFKNAVKLCCISPSTVAIEKSIFSEIGLFDENLPACEDYDFWLRVTAKFPVFLIPEYLTIKQGGHCDQQSKKYEAMDKFRIQALKSIIESNSLDKNNYAYAVKELVAKCLIYSQGALKRGKTDEANYYHQLSLQFKIN